MDTDYVIERSFKEGSENKVTLDIWTKEKLSDKFYQELTTLVEKDLYERNIELKNLKVEEKLICIRNLIMDNGSKYATKGKIYKVVNINFLLGEFIFINDNESEHSICFNENYWFKR